MILLHKLLNFNSRITVTVLIILMIGSKYNIKFQSWPWYCTGGIF